MNNKYESQSQAVKMETAPQSVASETESLRELTFEEASYISGGLASARS